MWMALLSALALAKPTDQTIEWDKSWQPAELSVAYRSHAPAFHHPGVTLQATWTGLQRHRTRTLDKPKMPVRHRTRSFFAGGQVFVDSHLTNHTFAGLQGVGGTKVVRGRGYMTSWTLEAGLQRSFLNHPSWWVDEDGEAYSVIGAGQFSGAVHLTHEWGIDFQRRSEHRERLGRQDRSLRTATQWFIRPRVGMLLGWSSAPFPVPSLSLDVGVRTSANTFRRPKGVQ